MKYERNYTFVYGFVVMYKNRTAIFSPQRDHSPNNQIYTEVFYEIYYHQRFNPYAQYTIYDHCLRKDRKNRENEEQIKPLSYLKLIVKALGTYIV